MFLHFLCDFCQMQSVAALLFCLCIIFWRAFTNILRKRQIPHKVAKKWPNVPHYVSHNTFHGKQYNTSQQVHSFVSFYINHISVCLLLVGILVDYLPPHPRFSWYMDHVPVSVCLLLVGNSVVHLPPNQSFYCNRNVTTFTFHYSKVLQWRLEPQDLMRCTNVTNINVVSQLKRCINGPRETNVNNCLILYQHCMMILLLSLNKE